MNMDHLEFKPTAVLNMPSIPLYIIWDEGGSGCAKFVDLLSRFVIIRRAIVQHCRPNKEITWKD